MARIGARKATAKRTAARRATPVPTAERWTAAKRATFLAELARTANVMASARTAGVPERSPYDLRRGDPDFRAAWDAAIDEGYDRLELLLLERATYGERPGGEGDGPEISTALALALLKSHHAKARRGPPSLPRPIRGAALRDLLEEKLAAMNRRMGGDG